MLSGVDVIRVTEWTRLYDFPPPDRYCDICRADCSHHHYDILSTIKVQTVYGGTTTFTLCGQCVTDIRIPSSHYHIHRPYSRWQAEIYEHEHVPCNYTSQIPTLRKL